MKHKRTWNRDWRKVVCTGCYRKCRYYNFHVFGQDAFAEQIESMHVVTEDSSKWKRKTRSCVLGRLHEAKLEQWSHFTNNCLHWGDIEKPIYDVGSEVTWTTRNNPHGQTHEGTVVEVVSANVNIAKLLPRYKGRYYFCMSDSHSGSRDHISYLVICRTPRGQRQDRLYWPRVRDIHPETEESEVPF